MQNVFHYGRLPIRNITEYITEVNGMTIPLELSTQNNSKEVDNSFGVYILKPGKIYTAISHVVLSRTDLELVAYDSITSPLLKMMCIEPNLYAVPIATEKFILVYSFSVVEPIKINISDINFGDVSFTYDDKNIPPFIKEYMDRIKQFEEVSKQETVEKESNEEIQEYEKDKDEYEKDMEVFDKADEEYQKHLQAQEEMQNMSSNSLIDIFDKAVEDMLNGSEDVEVELEDSSEEESEEEEE